MAKKKFYVVFAPNGKEGFITDDADQAEYARSGFSGGCKGVSCIGDALRNAYCDEPDEDGFDDTELESLEVEIEV